MCLAAAAAAPGIFQAISIGTSVAGTIFQFVGQRRAARDQARAERQRAEYDAAVARNNAILAERQAEDQREVGRIEESRHRQRIASMVGQTRAVLASSGFDATAGDAPALVADVAEQGDIEARTIRRNAENRARGLDFEAANFRANSDFILASGRSQRVSPFTGVGALISGVGTVADKWSRYNDNSSAQQTTPSPDMNNIYT